MSHPRVLTPKQVAWAHRKWCEGYRLEQIANALYCNVRTIQREFKRNGLHRVEIPLKYEEETP